VTKQQQERGKNVDRKRGKSNPGTVGRDFEPLSTTIDGKKTHEGGIQSVALQIRTGSIKQCETN